MDHESEGDATIIIIVAVIALIGLSIAGVIFVKKFKL
jgi:hypothetical protein